MSRFLKSAHSIDRDGHRLIWNGGQGDFTAEISEGNTLVIYPDEIDRVTSISTDDKIQLLREYVRYLTGRCFFKRKVRFYSLPDWIPSDLRCHFVEDLNT